MAKFDAHLKCSFCSKSQDQVRKLIAGPGVYICDECIDLCNEILDEELLESQAKTNISSPQVKKKLTNTQSETNDPLKIKIGFIIRWLNSTPILNVLFAVSHKTK